MTCAYDKDNMIARRIKNTNESDPRSPEKSSEALMGFEPMTNARRKKVCAN